LFPEAEKWLEDGSINLKGPLAGVPVSLKDSIAVGGWDVTVGYSRNAGKPYKEDGTLVRLLKEAGAVPFVKTALPITLLSFESTNDVWGQAKNPHNPKYSPGGSSGGEGALLASGASIIGVGSDVAGSVRVPAHFSGCYSLRCSTGRWPRMGVNTSMPGQEGIPSVFSPMTWSLDGLTYFTRSLIGMKPWRLDHTVHPLEWRDHIEQEYLEKKVLKIGILRDDGVVTPSPACARALDMAATSLKLHGHTVVDITPPSPYEALVIASQLLNADGCTTFRSFFRTGETDDPGAAQMDFYMRLPKFIKRIHYWWVKYVRRDDIWAGLLKDWHAKTAAENWVLVGKREAYKARWHDWWNEQGLDIMVTVPNATPAVPHGGMHDAVSSCGYTFLFNLVSSMPKVYLHRLLNTDQRSARLHCRYNASHQSRSCTRRPSCRLQAQQTQRCGERSICAL
jgi:Asp-tRNA(Asn)/Glu-tRNA(Gln) amidotransferase A subunit family amidase